MHSDLCQKPRAGPTSCGMGVSDYWLDGQDDLNSAFVSLCLVLRMFVIVILIDSCLAFFVFHSVVYCFVLLVPVTWFTVIGWLYRSSPKWPMTYNVSSEWVVKACYILCINWLLYREDRVFTWLPWTSNTGVVRLVEACTFSQCVVGAPVGLQTVISCDKLCTVHLFKRLTLL